MHFGGFCRLRKRDLDPLFQFCHEGEALPPHILRDT
uniref:Uncharacterized protein n=1 Tax=Anguilla anguilla TaxID=7936 RepID=A0A0E9TNA7_ANGAN